MIILCVAGIAQLVEHPPCKRKVKSSSLFVSSGVETKVAQSSLVERLRINILNSTFWWCFDSNPTLITCPYRLVRFRTLGLHPRNAGSNPARDATYINMNVKLEKYFIDAVRLALLDLDKPTPQKKKWLHAAIGIRDDGTIVHARNGGTIAPFAATPNSHAEARLCHKLGKAAPLVIVVRVNNQGQWMLSKPCGNCENLLRAIKVKKVLYTVSHEKWARLKL